MKARASLFDPAVPLEKQHKSFVRCATHRGSAPSRESLQVAYGVLPDPDENFIKDFQTTGFDARVWELYLMALFDSMHLMVAQPNDRPDFHLTRGSESVWIEATTANASDGVIMEPPAGYWDRLDHIAAKIGSPLYSKLNKRYWKLPHVVGTPLVLAIADFHEEGTTRATSEPLQRYLYGKHLRLTSKQGQEPTYELENLKSLGSKRTPAGFFALPGAEHISAVLFSNAGTVAKFSRMGFDRFRHPLIRMLRRGFSFRDDVNAILPEPFAYLVGDAPETWGQEATVFHNPNALLPLSRHFFRPLCQYWLREDSFDYSVPDFYPFVSDTGIACGHVHQMEAIEHALREEGRRWTRLAWREMPDFEAGWFRFHQDYTPS